MSTHTTAVSRGRAGLLTVATLVLLGAAAVVDAADVRAQEQQTDPTPVRMRGPSPEMVMSLRDRLELTEDQLQALEELRTESVAERSARRAEMEEMRSRFRAGQIDRAELRAFMESRQAQASGIEDRRARLEAVLDEDQLRTLNDLRVRRAEMRGRRAAMRGGRPGIRRGGRPGMRRGGRDRSPREAIRGPRAFRGDGRGMIGPRGFRRGRELPEAPAPSDQPPSDTSPDSSRIDGSAADAGTVSGSPAATS